MKAVSGKKMVTILEKRGWELDRITGSHHILKKSGIDKAIVVPVHGNRALKIGLQRAIMKIAGLGESDL